LPIERATTIDLGVGHSRSRRCRPTRLLLQDLLLAGRPTIGVIEALDHSGIWQQLLPSGRTCDPGRSTTRITVSPSIGIYWKRSPMGRSWRRRSIDQTCS
jgi:hypothetical protein